MKKHRFAVGLAIYGAVLLLLIIAGLFLFWRYIAAYERSLADGVMDSYMTDGLAEEIDRGIDRFASARETVFESAGEIARVLRSSVESGGLTYRKALQEHTPEEPVYSIRLDRRELGRVYLRSDPGGVRDFGFPRWFVHRVELDLDGFAQDYAVLAPAEAAVARGGVVMTAANCPITWEEPEELLPYSEELAQMPRYARYAFSSFSPVEISLPDGGEQYLLSREGNSFTVTQRCPAELSDQLYKYAEDFVRAYIDFTSGTVEEPDVVTGYMVTGGTLFQRMYAAMEGLSWIQAVTGRISELSVDGLRYYGCAATLEAHYLITTYGRIKTDNNMKIVLTETQQGWRVAEIQLF